MKKHIISLVGLVLYLILAGGSIEDTVSDLIEKETEKIMDEVEKETEKIMDDINNSYKSSKSNSSSSSSSTYSKPKKSRDEKVCQDPYGQWHSYISQCATCGTSYCVQYLPYGKYCSQNCCAAYEGLSSECGY